MQIHYLEIVTSNVDEMCDLYSRLHDVAFGIPDGHLGGARTARLANGGTLGIRAPMHEAERPLVRPYILVNDIEAAVKSAADAGAIVALPPMKIVGHGICAILIQGGIDSGLWQLSK